MIGQLKLTRIIKYSFLFLLVTVFSSSVVTSAKSDADGVCYMQRSNGEITNLDHLCQGQQNQQPSRPINPARARSYRSNPQHLLISQAEKEKLVKLLHEDKEAGMSYAKEIFCRQMNTSLEECLSRSTSLAIKEGKNIHYGFK